METINSNLFRKDIHHFMWLDELKVMINDYKDGNNEPLDEDETKALSKIIRAKLDYIEGNITEDEYLERF